MPLFDLDNPVFAKEAVYEVAGLEEVPDLVTSLGRGDHAVKGLVISTPATSLSDTDLEPLGRLEEGLAAPIPIDISLGSDT